MLGLMLQQELMAQPTVSLIAALKKSNINLDRKILAELAVNEPKAFSEIVKAVNK